MFLRFTRGETRTLMITVPYRRRLLSLDVTLSGDTDEDSALATITEILAPTFDAE